ncbi:DEAD/DEAH box helicase [Acetobacteraceae bacterium KSS8]|uniref:DEAD/DEAH box helicase n=1 Tax=Endosaccharibacter trunci TaxID=2812733 RepID=A0ABT1W4I1_9PROT|nr:DEAD/DEAH box helicase [Acetobacteraceae bacterium KSS8]
MTAFAALGLAEPLLQALQAADMIQPTPIQTEAIPVVMQGRDLIGLARTGTGKTASFVLPILHRLLQTGERADPGTCQALVLAPTRELARQICDAARTFGRRTTLRATTLVGGVPRDKQDRALGNGIDLVVATPGRLLDHLASGTLRLHETSILVLDEADHMLDLGFIDEVRSVAEHLPAQRQTLLFSATMPAPIAALAKHLLRNPVTIATAPPSSTAERIDHRIVFAEGGQKRALLVDMLRGGRMERTLVFVRTKQNADALLQALDSAGIRASAIHGDKSQAQRDRVLADFRRGAFPVLVATDVAARGIDIPDLTHVVNYEIPDVPETYVHRVGRTARAGARGIAISLCAGSERAALRNIEKLLGKRLRVYEGRQAAGRPV